MSRSLTGVYASKNVIQSARLAEEEKKKGKQRQQQQQQAQTIFFTELSEYDKLDRPERERETFAAVHHNSRRGRGKEEAESCAAVAT